MKRLLVALLVCITLFSLGFATSETPTSVEIDNSLYQAKTIEDIFIFGNRNTIDFMDLDEYFIDDNGGEPNMTYSLVENVLITIDSEHKVSFYPDADYLGTQVMNFSATSSSETITSNNFNLTVREDPEAPKWYSPRKNRNPVYQNNHINFTTFWEDNIELASYIFSIKQGDTWINSSLTSFSGQQNISNNKTQITASPLTTVFWKFYAFDGEGNMNVTDMQNFSVAEYDTSGGNTYTGSQVVYSSDETTTTAIIIRAINEIFSSSIGSSGFKVSVSSIKLSLRQRDSITKVIKIKNLGTASLDFSAYFKDVDIFGTLSDSTFTIGAGETKELSIDFQIPKDAIPGQYFDTLILKSGESANIPIIIDVKNFKPEISITTFISEENRIVDVNKEVIATVTIKNLGDIGELEVDLFYAIKDLRGNIILSKNKKIILSTIFEEEASLIVPEDTPEGEYIFYTRATSDDLIDLDSNTFFVGHMLKIILLIKKYIYLIILSIMVAVILLLTLIYKKTKKKKRVLELYLLLNELKSLVKEGKTTEALEIYKRIKIAYGQNIPKGFSEDKEKLKAELEKYSKLLKKSEIPIPVENPSNPKPKEPIKKNPQIKTETKPKPPLPKGSPENIPKVKTETKPKPLPQKELPKNLPIEKKVATPETTKTLDKIKPEVEKPNEK